MSQKSRIAQLIDNYSTVVVIIASLTKDEVYIRKCGELMK